MAIAPPPLLVAIIRRCIPPDDREPVLGDLEERLQSTGSERPALQYLLDATQTVPLVIWSRMRRVIAHPLFVMQAFMLLTAFLAAALGTPGIDGFAFLVTDQGLLRIAALTLVALFVLVLADTDTYRPPAHMQPWTHLACVAVALGGAWASNGMASAVAPAWSLPRSMMVRGLMFAFLSLSWARFVVAFRGIEQHIDTPVPKTVGDLRVHVQRFEAGVRRRNLFAYVTCLIVIAGFVWIATLALNLLQIVRAVLVVAAGIGLAYQVSRYRPVVLPTEAGYEASLRRYRDELTRQRDFHRGRQFWLRLAVLVPGALLVDAGFALARPNSVRTIGLHALVFLALAVLTVPLNRRAARRYDRQINQVTSALRNGS